VATIGYARVSTIDQNPQIQLDALRDAGASRIFTDHGASGSAASRPELAACLDHLREGDLLAVLKLDRLGRNTQHVLAVIDELTSHSIGFRSLTEGLHTEGPMGKAMLTIMAAFAQIERDTMIERTRAGLVAAATNGRKGGRPRKIDDADAVKARSLREKGITARDIAKMLGVSRCSVGSCHVTQDTSARCDSGPLMRAPSCMADSPAFRTGQLSVLLPASTPEHRVRALLRQKVVDVLAATHEWPAHMRVVSSRRVSDGPMRRWFVEYDTGPYGETLDEPDPFD
jgi:DNA invertase Pin-like site-specific DNA recombinase